MDIPDKLIKYFEKNKTKSKDEMIKEMMLKFNYQENTALTYYSKYKPYEKSIKEFLFNFFKEHPKILNDEINAKYADKLKIDRKTYTKYKSEYKALHPIKEEKKMQDFDKYYNGKLRKKFTFDDSKLFG